MRARVARGQEPIVAALQQSGLQADCPFQPAGAGGAAEQLTPESAADVDATEFAEYAGRLNQYLQARCSRPLQAACASMDPKFAGNWCLNQFLQADILSNVLHNMQPPPSS